MQNFFVMAKVVLYEPIHHDQDHVVGYYMSIGAAASDRAQATLLIERAMKDGSIDWRGSEWRDLSSLAPEIVSRSVGVSETSIWYKSGRVFF